MNNRKPDTVGDGGMRTAMVKLSRALGNPKTVEAAPQQCVEAALIERAAEGLTHAADANPLPNPAQLRALARPAPAPRPCVPGRHCERRARDLGACIAGDCNPPRAADPRFAAAHYMDGRDVVVVQCDSHAPPVGVPSGVAPSHEAEPVCDCQDPDHGLVSNECPVHNENPRTYHGADGVEGRKP